MPRVLTMQRTIVPPAERKNYLARLRRKREHYARANCSYWVFEETTLPGAFLEFFEAADEETLAGAHAGAPEAVLDPQRTYREVELR